MLSNREALVTKQLVIPFSIGKSFKDEVICDVVPMSASYLLLGIVHLGFKTTILFSRIGK